MNAKIIFLSLSLLNLSALAMESDPHHPCDADQDKQQQKTELNLQLIEAIRHNQGLKTIQNLLDLGADVNATDKHDTTPLIYAAARDNLNLIDLLIKRQANINHQDKSEGISALMMAAAYGHHLVILSLLEHGADAKLRSTDGKNALMIAEETNERECCEILFAAMLDLTPEQKQQAINARIDLRKIRAFIQPHKLGYPPKRTYTPN